MNTQQQIIERLNELDQRTAIHEAHTTVLADVVSHVLRELAVDRGVSPGDFDTHYVMLRNRFHSLYLDKVSQCSKHVAGLIDDRPESAIDIGDPIPPLFPPQASS